MAATTKRAQRSDPQNPMLSRSQWLRKLSSFPPGSVQQALGSLMADLKSKQVYVAPPPATALGLATAYQASQALIVAVKLGVPDVLAKGTRTGVEIAQEVGNQSATTCSARLRPPAFPVDGV